MRAQTMIALHTFSGPDGSNPAGGLVMDRGGNLYGTAGAGGTNGYGTVFKLSQERGSWMLTTIHRFQGGNDGAHPGGRVVFGPDGDLYGTTAVGGIANNGTVFRLTPPATFCRSVQCPWTETVLYAFTGGSDGANPQNVDLAFDSAGNIYGATYLGGRFCQGDCGVVFKLTKSGQHWTETTLYEFSGPPDGARPLGGVAFDSAGNLFGTTIYGGVYDGGTLFELSPTGSGWTETVLHSFGNGSDGFGPAAGVILDQQENIFGTTSQAGTNYGGIAFELSSSAGGWTYLVLTNFTGGRGGPSAVPTLDVTGNLFGGTYDDGAYHAGNLYELVPDGHGNWTNLDLFDFGYATYGVVVGGAVVVDSSGNVYGTATSGGAHDLGTIWEYQVN
ncbi:MAG: choice-of-anchor tandem repeat GloVer-containing protein [Candidatus Korobacteraceae bacterium]